MNAPVRQLLESFDALPDADKRRAAAEILRRVAVAESDPSEAMLLGAADERFRTLDREEASHAQR